VVRASPRRPRLPERRPTAISMLDRDPKITFAGVVTADDGRGRLAG
jgi:hypothetical protein